MNDFSEKTHKKGELRQNVSDPRLAPVALLSVRQMSELLALHPRTVWRMSAAGELPRPIRIGGKSVRWRYSDLAAFIQGGTL